MKSSRISILSGFERILPKRLSSLRSRLILGNILITFIAIVAMGYYVYFRVQESNTSLADQLESNVRNKAEDELSTTAREQAALLDNFFASMRENVSTLGTIEGRMLSQESVLNSGIYWDASTSLFRLDSGSWDNSNTEIASVFIPSAVNITGPLSSKLNVLKQTELIVPSILDSSPDIIAIYFGGASGETIYYPNIDLAAIVPPDFDVTSRPWFVDAAPEQNPQRDVVWSAPYQDAALNGLVITASTPVLDEQGGFHGVAAMDIQLTRITNLISKISIGETGYAFLIDNDNRLIALPQAGYGDFGVTAETVPFGEILDPAKLSNMTPGLFDILNSFSSGGSQLLTANLGGIERFIIHQNIPETNYSLAIIVPTEELLAESAAVRAQIAQETRDTITVSALLVVLILVIASFAALGIANRLTSPLKSLTIVANEIIHGNLDAKAQIQRNDELGTLAETLNLMTSNFKGLVKSLEERVSERTAELKEELVKGERRGKQFEAIAKVAQTISVTQNLQELLPQISKVVSEHFGFYHVGIFINDASNQYAVLGAANSPGGKKMLNRGHQLKVGEQGIVGYVTGTGNPRIALDVGEDVVFFNNPDLPETHSEMALPLKVTGSIIGALDVQSTEPNAFSKEDVDVLSTLADQISLAIENARLFDQTQKTLVEAEAIQRQYIRETWNRLPKEEKLTGYRYSIAGAIPLNEETEPAGNGEVKNKQEVSVPIILRGETIGTLTVQVPKSEHVSADQVDLIKAVAERVALSAENARLFEETTRRAERERVISDIASKIGTSVRTESILQTTARELSQILNGADILIKLESQKDNNGAEKTR